MLNRKKLAFGVPMLLFLTLTLPGCSDDDDGFDIIPNQNTSDPATFQADMVIMNRIDDSTGFMVAVDASQDTYIANTYGIELNPAMGIVSHKGMVYTLGSLVEDKVAKYSLKGNIFTKEGEFITGEGARVGSVIFVNDNKAYVVAYHEPKLVIFDPQTMSVTGEIDLSSYALGTINEYDSQGNVIATRPDNNPNASSGVIRDGKLYLGLSQIDTFETFRCQGGASVAIIDTVTDTLEKHIQDPRACSTGLLEPGNKSIFVDEIGDIYVANHAAYGFYPGLTAGYLRIKNGDDQFDPDYFLSITDLDLPEVPGGKVSYSYRDIYAGDGIVYANLFVPGLTSNPPDFANDKNYLAYKIDLRAKIVTALDIPPTAGWSATAMTYNDRIAFGRSTDNGAGLFFYYPSSGTNIGDQVPSIVTEGTPVWMVNF